LLDGLANDAPETAVDSGESLDGRTPAAAVDAGLVHFVPEFLDLEWILEVSVNLIFGNIVLV
jgi:hypothetical protein